MSVAERFSTVGIGHILYLTENTTLTLEVRVTSVITVLWLPQRTIFLIWEPGCTVSVKTWRKMPHELTPGASGKGGPLMRFHSRQQ